LRHEIRPWNSIDAESAERLKKPESGTGVSVDSSLQLRGQIEDAVERRRDAMEGRIRLLTDRTVER